MTITGHMPYDDDADEDVEGLYLNRVFPTIACLGSCGLVITRCSREHNDCEGAVEDLNGFSA